jgi:hypothetical protein
VAPANFKDLESWIKAGLFFVFLSSFLAFLSANNCADADLWGYMAFGRLFWQSPKFPYQDVFSYTPTLNPWVYHEWLTGVLFYPLHQALGAPGLQVLKYGLGLAAMGLVYLTARLRGAHPLPAALFIAIILSVIRYGYNPVRAQVFTFCFFALSLYMLEQARLSGQWRYLLLLPLLQIPWCNLHGGFPAGLGLIAIYAAGEFFSRRPYLPYVLIFLGSMLVTLINPYGVAYWKYIIRAVNMPRPNITEWTSLFRAYQTGLVDAMLLIYLLVLVFVGLWVMWRSRWREVTASLALAVTFCFGVRHIRHLAFFLILAGAYLPVCFNVNVDYLRSHPGLKKLWNLRRTQILVLTLLAGLTLANFSLFVMRNPLSLQLPEKPASPENILFYPLGAVNFVKKQGFSGKILTVFRWGEYLIWELYPRCLVAFDGRYETVYPREVEEKFSKFNYAHPGWRQFLEDYPPDLILLDKRAKIAALIQKEPRWRQIYSDRYCVLFMARKKRSKIPLYKRGTLD